MKKIAMVLWILGLGILSCQKEKDDSSDPNLVSGKVVFENEAMDAANVDVFIPKTSFVAKTDNKGNFELSTTLTGKQVIRFQKGIFIKDVKATIVDGEETDLNEVTIDLMDRNPLPLIDILEGTWEETCYSKNATIGSNAENPSSGVIHLRAPEGNVILNDNVGIGNAYFVKSGASCLVESFNGVGNTTVSLIVPNDYVIIREYNQPQTNYSFNHVLRYTDDEIDLLLGSNTDSAEALVELRRQ